MNITGTRQGLGLNLSKFLSNIRLQRGMVFGIIILTALLAFESFNYSTTEFALGDVLGNMSFAGLHWATILSIAFCGIDFAGIARLFTPEQKASEPNEVWYLFGAWLLAATMNAILTWWGVSMAIVNHPLQSSSVIDQGTLLRVVPVFVAVMVWLIRILIIGSLSYAGDRLFSQTDRQRTVNSHQNGVRSLNTISTPSQAAFSPNQAASRPAPKPLQRTDASFGRSEPAYSRPEPTYHSVSMSPRTVVTSSREVITPDTRR
jgi:hypothetical protein